MATFRLQRNILKSLKTYLAAKLSADGWTGVTVDYQTRKTFSQTPKSSPQILLSIIDTANQKMEIGGKKFLRFPNIVIRIFGTDNGNREDLSDWMHEKLEDNIPYYAYTLQTGGTFTSVLAGNIVVLKIIRDEHELGNTDPSVLEECDRYRHNITFSCYVGEL